MCYRNTQTRDLYMCSLFSHLFPMMFEFDVCAWFGKLYFYLLSICLQYYKVVFFSVVVYYSLNKITHSNRVEMLSLTLIKLF